MFCLLGVLALNRQCLTSLNSTVNSRKRIAAGLAKWDPCLLCPFLGSLVKPFSQINICTSCTTCSQVKFGEHTALLSQDMTKGLFHLSIKIHYEQWSWTWPEIYKAEREEAGFQNSLKPPNTLTPLVKSKIFWRLSEEKYNKKCDTQNKKEKLVHKCSKKSRTLNSK